MGSQLVLWLHSSNSFDVSASVITPRNGLKYRAEALKSTCGCPAKAQEDEKGRRRRVLFVVNNNTRSTSLQVLNSSAFKIALLEVNQRAGSSTRFAVKTCAHCAKAGTSEGSHQEGATNHEQCLAAKSL